MDHPGLEIRGLDLRYVLTTYLLEAPADVTALQRRLRADGFTVAGRPSKTISDALRWEVGRGRVVRSARARYGPGAMPRQTKSRIRRRVAELGRHVGEAHLRLDPSHVPPRSDNHRT